MFIALFIIGFVLLYVFCWYLCSRASYEVCHVRAGYYNEIDEGLCFFLSFFWPFFMFIVLGCYLWQTYSKKRGSFSLVKLFTEGPQAIYKDKLKV